MKHISSAAVIAIAALAPSPALAQYNNPYSPYASLYSANRGQTSGQIPPYANPNFGGGYTNQMPGRVPSYVNPNGFNGGSTVYSSPGAPPPYPYPRP